MALFRRRASTSEDPVMAFWDWWAAEGRPLAEQSIGGRVSPEAFAQEMAPRVRSLGQLGWELAAGETSRHVLVVTAEGDPAGRAVARRVVLAAPDADADWSYVDTRPPATDPEAVVLSAPGGAEIEFSKVEVAARMNGGHLDMEVYHPAFSDLTDEGRLQITFLALDATLGEVDAELWLGEVHPAEAAPLDGFGLAALRAVVHDLKRKHLDEDGNPGWATLHGETSAGPLVAVARSPLHPLTAPHLDTHVAVMLPYDDPTDDGLPADGSLGPLRQLEERLDTRLGTHGVVVAHQSNAGVRTLHVYLDSTAGLLPTVKEVARSWGQGKATVHDMYDPGWLAVSHLRG